jgi:hypothetical protein
VGKIIPASPLVRIKADANLARAGQELVFDPDDIESVELNTPIDTIDVTPPDAEFARHEAGRRHIDLHITFKEGKGPKWTDATERG